MPIKTGIFNSDLPHHFYNKINTLALVADGFGRFLLAVVFGENRRGRNGRRMTGRDAGFN